MVAGRVKGAAAALDSAASRLTWTSSLDGKEV